ncbi:MAG: hypothetical protein IPK75_19710 [Acidobacteria bacterium]|nr:hypothetical protein [Acidobacteriota bacterium]
MRPSASRADSALLRFSCCEASFQDVERGLLLIQPGARVEALRQKAFIACNVAFLLFHLRLQSLDCGAERGELRGKGAVRDHCDQAAGLDDLALDDVQLRDHALKARPGGRGVARFDAGNDRPVIDHDRFFHGQGLGKGDRGRGHQHCCET